MKQFGKFLVATSLALGATFGAQADVATIHTPAGYQVLAVSPNGRWATGVYQDAYLSTYPFRWNLESGTIEMLGSAAGTAWDIANDGTISGDFPDTQAVANGAPVSMPGLWYDGKWHHLELPSGYLRDGMGGGISPDGRYMVGSIEINGYYRPYMWKDGQLYRSLSTAGSHGVLYCVNHDGSMAAGWEMLYNRTATLWGPDGARTNFEDSPEHSHTPWSYARNFSPDGRLLLYWGGWLVDDAEGKLYLYSIYDVENDQRIMIEAPSMESDLEFFDLSNDGLLVGYDSSTGMPRGYLWQDGQGMYIDDYLAAKGIDLSGFDDFYGGEDFYQGILPINRVVSLSEDGSVLAMNYYNKIGEPCTLVIKTGFDGSQLPPSEVKARQLTGLSTVALSWMEPVGAQNIRGYNVYRNGQKLNGFLPLNRFNYYDTDLAEGSYDYVIATVNAQGVETRAEAVTVEVGPAVAQQPNHLFARNKGINDAFLTWDAPMCNIPHWRYFDLEDDYQSFSIYEPLTIEAAIRYDADITACYQGFRLSEVTFLPVEEQKSWAVNVYTRNAYNQLQLLSSQPITQELKYRELNTVRLAEPVDIPAGELIVAIEVTVKDGSQAVLGADKECFTPAYSDLLRRKSDLDFISCYESSLDAGISLTFMSWVIDLGLEPADFDTMGNAIDHYNVYINDEKVAETADCSYVAEGLADGEYAMAVEAVYANGSLSQPVTTSLNVESHWPAVTDVAVEVDNENTTVNASWQAPVTLDEKWVSYTNAQTPGMGIMGNSERNYALMVAADYSGAIIRGYDGYRIKSFRFYPLADAIFTFFLYKNGTRIYELEVYDYELNKWNTIEVPDELIIDESADYRLAVDVFDPMPETRVLPIDTQAPREFISDLYSVDNGETWESLCTETGAYGNWMIGMDIAENVAAEPLTVDGYDVVIDGKVVNGSTLAETAYAHNYENGDNATHTLRVDVYYPARAEAVSGEETNFYLADSGIESGIVSSITLRRGANYLIAEGEGVESLEVYSSAGTKVAEADGQRVDISALAPGVYVVRINAGAASRTAKVSIAR